MEKHVYISNENMKIYCHFFNNEKTCPYENECIFLHDVAGLCRYGVLWKEIIVCTSMMMKSAKENL